ncbi:AAA family ATPase [Christiangramia forsetii]|uniref:Rad50/SbcC-type AAA domain-containing protein n=2 Tax=Christiangramia forsetii TaxID=411153 RepID=A0M498_CHRFK|nr:AAA family ATPase [Christiangramia forsetii]GGG23911.1 hypothetical protein GCM10011532_03910 [Christiangramia forsetii]CAL67443.1 conserved hypothetical protein [Christiangramia forsetii KT0803]
MKTIQIKSLILRNFKGIKNLKIEDFQKETSIWGANATGKTTIVDAFSWLLFGKDSTDRTNFEIKTLDKNNQVIPKIDHEVEAVITVDGEEIGLKRTYREKWTKKKGALVSEFNGHETLYSWNEVPMTQRDYTAKISSLVDESVFKLITSPAAFNLLKWQDQRQVLLDIAWGITDEQVAKGNPEFEDLFSKLTNKSLEEYEKQIKASILKSKKEINVIPTRIDEVERNKPEAIDFDDVERDIQANKKELEGVEKQISDKLESEKEVQKKKSAIQKQIHVLESQIEDEKHRLNLKAKSEYQKQTSASNDIQSQINAKNEDLTKAQKTLAKIKADKKEKEQEIESLSKQNKELLEKWHKRAKESFQMDESDCKCPTCKREFEAEDIEQKKSELESNFNENKRKDLAAITAKGQGNGKLIDEAKIGINTLDERIEIGTGKIEEITEELTELDKALETAKDNSTNIKNEKQLAQDLIKDSQVISGKVSELNILDKELSEIKPVDVSELKTEKDKYATEISNLKSKLSIKDQIAAADKRKEELSEEEGKLAQQIADYEKDQYIIEQFNKAKMDTLENIINEKFQMVNFKLFEAQVNGAEAPTCKALINGVPFSDANTASKINAGIDIINTLSDHYGVSAPVFIDNRESVSNLIESQSQIINLIVSPDDKKLRVESNVEQL